MSQTYIVSVNVDITYLVEAESEEDAVSAYSDGRIHALEDVCDWDTQSVRAVED